MNPERRPAPPAEGGPSPDAVDDARDQARLEEAWRARLLERPSEAAFREAYDAVHRTMRRRPGRELLYAAGATRVDRAFLASLGSARRVLDVGAGNGRFARAASAGRQVVAVEISGEAMAAMRSLVSGGEGPRLCQASALHLPFRAGSFDTVVSQDLIEHLHPEHLAPHLAEVHRVLAPGGRYFLHTPSALHGPSSLGLHLREYRVREVARAARAAGFRPRWICLTLARFGWARTLPGWAWPAVQAWEAAWEASGRAGLRRLGGRWYAAGVPEVDLDLGKPSG